MNAKEIDLVMDALLKEDASGGSDECLSAAIEMAIASGDAGEEESVMRPRRSRMMLAWAALLVVSLGGVVWMIPSDGRDPGAGEPGSVGATSVAMAPDRAQAMLLRIEEVVSKSDQTPTRISFTYKMKGSDRTEEFTMGSTWPAFDSVEGVEFPFLLEQLPDGRRGIGVYIGRLVRYLEQAGADPAEVNNALLVDTNHRENGNIVRPGLPSRLADPVVVLRDAGDLAVFKDGFACATLLRTYLAGDMKVVPPEGTGPDGPAVEPSLAVITPEVGEGVPATPVDFISPGSESPGSGVALGKPRATLTGFDSTKRYSDVPPITVTLRDVPPTSTTFMRVGRGVQPGKLSEVIEIPSSEIVLRDSTVRNRILVAEDLNPYLTREGPYLIEIVTQSPSSTELLCSKRILVDRTVELRGGIFTVDSGGQPAPGPGARGGFGMDREPRGSGFGVRLPVDRERYGQLVDQPWKTPASAALSTFSVDVDTASYTNIRRMLRSGQAVPADAVRLEECVNYFDYDYETPTNGGPFAVHVDLATCPWEAAHHLVKIGIKGKELHNAARPPSNLVFLIDVSGSMNAPGKLPRLVESMKMLVEELDERDSVGIVVYAGSAGTVLEPTTVAREGRDGILGALNSLRAGGSTAGAAGIKGAYALARKHYRENGVNRVILATDGDFNVGTSSDGELVELVTAQAAHGVYLSVLGFGTGNLNDSMMEAVTNAGNGNYFYIDSRNEARKIFLMNLTGTLMAIAKDVKIQVEFNPGKVAAYRLIGYANRILRDEDFDDDQVDAGDLGAGHTVTALYELVPVGGTLPALGRVDPLKYQRPPAGALVESPDWMTVKLRYKAPDGDTSRLLEVPVAGEPSSWEQASPDFIFAAAVSLFAEKLRSSDQIGAASWHLVADLALRGCGEDRHGHRREFLELVGRASRFEPNRSDREDEAPLAAPGRAAEAEAPPAR